MSSGFVLGLVLWGFWLLTMAIFFSVDGSFHQYYMTEMAPGLSALVGIGLVVMWQQYRSTGWRGWLLPVALVVTAATQIYMLMSYPSWSRWLSPLIGILTVLVVITLIFLRLRPRLNLSKSMFRGANVVVSAGLLALFVSPAVWAGYSVIYNTESSFPTAGPNAQNNRDDLSGGSRNGTKLAREQMGFDGPAGGFGGFAGGSAQTDPALISYLETHQGNAKFLVATSSSRTADPIILATNKPVMALGGFSGNDPILTTNDLQTLIKNGTVRFFLINSQRGAQRLMDQLPKQHRKISSGRGHASFNFGSADLGGGGFGDVEQNSLSTWVNSHCSAVPTSNWQSSTSNFRTSQGNSQLYDCVSARA
jgi:4-amino-4-deoxy-L-arabinose transferase-like glycosyltransferase